MSHSRKTRSTYVFGLTLVAVVIAVVAAAVPAVAGSVSPSCVDPNPSTRSLPLEQLPAACYLIFSTEHEAASHCPIGIKPTKVFDFWQHNFLGWSCDCGPTDSLPYGPGSDDPIDV